MIFFGDKFIQIFLTFKYHKSQQCTLGVARNNLVFSALSIFRVEGSVTLKMLNLFIVNR